uniref:DUF4419 domain-containing protein n=1 Tax=Fusarium oxysporum (strain Fo5176) TaxID=660025 RepID=A0A0D2XU63_FUSOF
MPVTVAIPNRKVSSWQDPKAENTSQLLRGAISQEASSCKQIIQSSFSFNGSLEENHVSASRNGLVWSSFHAYSTHHHLTIRPEDVWFAIVTNSIALTLLGEVTDYEDILKRLDKLEEMGEEPIQFANLLRPILRNMVLSFTQPSDRAIHTFWNQIADMDRMSGSNKMTGWITAFCYWDDEGKVHPPSRANCTLEGLMYPYVETDNIPCGYVTVPVEVDDNGTLYDCKMLAGSVGIQAVPGSEGYVPAFDPYEKRRRDVEVDEKKLGIKPVTGWMIYEFVERKGPGRRRPR